MRGTVRASTAAGGAAAAGPRARPAAPAPAAPRPRRAGARRPRARQRAPGPRSSPCAGSPRRRRGRGRRVRLRAARAVASARAPATAQRAACAGRRARTAAAEQPLLQDADQQVAAGGAAERFQVRGVRVGGLAARPAVQQRRREQVLRRPAPRSAARSARGLHVSGAARTLQEASLTARGSFERCATSGGERDEEGGGSAGAPFSHASTAQRPEWYCARIARGAAASAPAPLSVHQWSTTCGARRRLGGSLRRAGLPQAGRRGRTCRSVGAHEASMERALTLSELLAASSAHRGRARSQAIHVAPRVPAAA